jgi:hypothetical protein
MTTSKICIMAVMFYPIISAIIAIFLCENYEDKFSEREKVCYAICWPLAIVLCPIFYLIKKIKLNIKTKETSKLEEYRHKKETVYAVLKELKIR